MSIKTKIVEKEFENSMGIKYKAMSEEVIPKMCKDCNEYVRENGSSRCKICSDNYKNDSK